MRKIKSTLLRSALLLVGLSFVLVACESPYTDPDGHGYGYKGDLNPWFDGVPYAYFQEMWDTKSIKPQGVGSYQQFPVGSVPIKMVLGKKVSVYDPFISADSGLRESMPINTVAKSDESINKGRVLYNTYCTACHGIDGKAETPVTDKGMMKMPIDALVGVFSEAHFYNKIKYGSFYQEYKGLMPAYGAQTSQEDRWNMVNYLKSDQFGKEEGQ